MLCVQQQLLGDEHLPVPNYSEVYPSCRDGVRPRQRLLLHHLSVASVPSDFIRRHAHPVLRRLHHR